MSNKRHQIHGCTLPDGSVVTASISGTMKCTAHDLEVIGSHPSWVKLWEGGHIATFAWVVLEHKKSIARASVSENLYVFT